MPLDDFLGKPAGSGRKTYLPYSGKLDPDLLKRLAERLRASIESVLPGAPAFADYLGKLGEVTVSGPEVKSDGAVRIKTYEVALDGEPIGNYSMRTNETDKGFLVQRYEGRVPGYRIPSSGGEHLVLSVTNYGKSSWRIPQLIRNDNHSVPFP